MTQGGYGRYNESMKRIPLKLKTKTNPRVHPRVRITGQVMIHDEERLFIAPLSDISAGGVFVNHLVTIPLGRTVKVIVKGPRFEKPVQAEGTVVRVDKSSGRQGLAVQFTGISEVARDAIQACVFESRMEAALKAA